MIKKEKKKEYVAPYVELLTARVEKGFAGSGGSNNYWPGDSGQNNNMSSLNLDDSPSLPTLGE